MRSSWSQVSTIRSMPMTATWTRGTVVHEPAVALVLDQHDRARLGDGEVAARHAEVGGEEPGAQLLAGEGGERARARCRAAVGPGDRLLEDVARPGSGRGGRPGR